jgi:uncharacterized membrane protein
MSLGAALTALALVATSAPAEAGRCRPMVVDLGALPGASFSVAFAINDAGAVAGWGMNANNQQRALRWAHGRVEELSVPPGGGSTALDINAAGTIVGRHNIGPGLPERGFVWHNGRATSLPGLPGGSGQQARRISDTGIVAGSAFDAAGREHVALWKHNRIIDVGIPPGYDGAFALDVGNEAEVVLAAYNDTEFVGFRWQRRTFQRLPGLADLGSWPQVDGSHGETGGFSFLPDDRTEATIWDRHGRPRPLGFLGGGDSSSILGTDGAGTWVGVGNSTPGGIERALITRGHGPLRTLQAISGPDGRSAARDINGEGHVVGISSVTEDVGHATLWTCAWRQATVPHPSR